jgi:hypothetical protein
MLLNVNLTAQLDLGSSKTGHYQFQIRPLGVETGQYPSLGVIRGIPVDSSHCNVFADSAFISAEAGTKSAIMDWSAKS